MLAGGNPVLLMHVSEFVVIGGISIGILVVASPKSVLQQLLQDVITSFSTSVNREEFVDIMKMLYELFMIGRRNGLIALDEHLSEMESSSIIQKYPSFLKDPRRIEFLSNALRPIIDGKIKPDQLQSILEAEIDAMEEESHRPSVILSLVGDSLPGIGIIAAVLGIINTMSAIAEGPEMVGEKVAAALTGTFLGILGAYGFINPLQKRIDFNTEAKYLYFHTISKSVSGFAKGLAPLMAIEVARRGLSSDLRPEADELERILKEAQHS